MDNAMMNEFLLELMRTCFDEAYKILENLYDVHPFFAVVAIASVFVIPTIQGFIENIRSRKITKRAKTN